MIATSLNTGYILADTYPTIHDLETIIFNVEGYVYSVSYGNIPASYAQDNSNLKNLFLGGSVSIVGDFAFAGCFGFSGSLTLPSSLTSIGEGAFDSCSGFSGDLTLPPNLTSIGSYAFAYCSGFTGGLTLPPNLTSIGSYAFAYCNGFTGDLTLPSSLTSIGEGAFAYCSGFTGDLTLPPNLTSIGDYAFAYYSGFTRINCYTTLNAFSSLSLIGSSITTIHVRLSDSTWTAGPNQTIGGQSGITVIKDL